MKLQPLPKYYDEDNMGRWRPLKEGDVFKELSGASFYVEYINSSGAYVLPLASSVREVAGKEIQFTSGGKSVSANSVVAIISPLELGGNSIEFARYVKLEGKKGRQVAMPKGAGTVATFAEFDDTPIDETATEPAETGTKEKKGMAATAVKAKAKANGNGAAKRDKAPKTVRKCVCGCGAETTGHFAPGHDARYHGWLRKMETGKMGPGELPAVLRKSLEMKQTKEGFKVTNPSFYKTA